MATALPIKGSGAAQTDGSIDKVREVWYNITRKVGAIMTLKEFLKMNTNGLLLQIFIYDKENEYIMGDEKRYFIDKNIFLDKTVLSFEIDENDLYIKLNF